MKNAKVPKDLGGIDTAEQNCVQKPSFWKFLTVL